MTELGPFKLERYFAEYEFKVRYLLSASDCEALTLRELLALADDDARARWEALSLGYTESPGHPALREEIARLYETLRPENAVVMVPEEGIYIAMHTLLAPGDHLVAVTPAYQSLQEVARSLGCGVSLWPARAHHDGWRFDPEELSSLITPRTRLLVINFPHNPTGALPARADFDAALDLARQRGLWVFSDEMYRLLEHDEAARLPAACDAYERGVTLSGLSKSFALPGLRLGWLATRAPGLVDRWLAFKDYTTICHSAPSEILGLMALRAREAILRRNRAIVRENRARAEAFCAAHPGHVRWRRPDGGSIAYPEWTGPGTVDDFCRAVLEAEGVMVVPGRMFDDAGPHFRLGLGRRSFGEALARVAAFLEGR